MTPRKQETKSTWGDRLSRRRGAMTQGQLAELAGTQQQTVSKIETNEIQPRPDLQGRLASALGTTPTELFPWDEYELSKKAGEPARQRRLDGIARRRREAVAS